MRRSPRECLDLGLHVSFAGSVSYTNKKFQPLRAVAATIPADRILLETDSPYLMPHPLRGKQQRNEPARMVPDVPSVLAELRGRTWRAGPPRPPPTPSEVDLLPAL